MWVVAPGHTEAEARKVAREFARCPAEAVDDLRKLLKLPPEDWTRRDRSGRPICSGEGCAPGSGRGVQRLFERRKG